MIDYLLLINIGPVQEFIAAARRSRDFWYGSWLLSELSKAAARAIADQHGIESLIFPAPASRESLGPTSDLLVPNKVIAQINVDPNATAEHAEAVVRMYLRTLSEAALGQVKGEFFREEAYAQIADLLEWYWVALPISTDVSYPLLRGQLEALATARKLTRDTRPVPYAAMVPKSSIDGLRESVIAEEQYDRLSPDQLFDQYGARPGERLSGVDLLKRHGSAKGEERFPSTSHLAATPLLQGMRVNTTPQQQALAAWSSYREALRKAKIDLGQLPHRFTSHPLLGSFEGSLLFEERLAEELSEKHVERLAKAQQALRTFLATVTNGVRPYPYYTLFHADGDEMGDVIDAQETIDDHRALSRALGGFAASVRTIVETDHQGALVYAGGDDVLAFLPLHTVIPCAARLAKELAAKLAPFAQATMSAGVVITHHLEPLSDALRLVLEAERKAKALPGKNALAVTLSKRGGGDTTVCGYWGGLDERLIYFSELFRDGDFPDGAAFELQSLANRLHLPNSHPDAKTLQQAQHVEAKRILARKLKLQDLRFQRLDHLLVAPALSVRQLADELVIAREIARGLEQAKKIER